MSAGPIWQSPSPTRTWLLGAGLAVLAAAWLGPLPARAREDFVSHMLMHMSVVAVAAPLLAAGVAGTALDPLRRRSWLLPPVLVSAVELVVVWSWHAPVLHHLSRHQGWAMAIEQGSFLATGTAVWLAALGGGENDRPQRWAAGMTGLLMTSLHMTLLGVLLALAPRPLYDHAVSAGAMQAQQLGGVLMLLGGGVSYLAGGLYLLWRLLGRTTPAVSDAIDEPIERSGR